MCSERQHELPSEGLSMKDMCMWIADALETITSAAVPGMCPLRPLGLCQVLIPLDPLFAHL